MIGRQFVGGERAEMVEVGIQCASQARALMDQSDPCMTPAMDSPLVAFGLAKPTFQVQIVSRHVIDRAQKQARQKAAHQSRQVLGERVFLLGEILAEFLKRTAAVLLRALSRIKRIGHGLDLFHLRSQFALSLLHDLQPAVDAGR